MDRKEHLKICKRCTNRAFDFNKGIVCGLTNDIATFEVNCSDYVADEEAIRKEDAIDLEEVNASEAVSRTRSERYAALREQIDPERAVKSAANWFYWIAALSLINSLMLLAGKDFGFILGLGITQIFDGIILEVSGDYNLLSLMPSLAVSSFFAVLAYFAHKYSRTAFIIGMICYGLDALIFLLGPDYFAIGFHVFALFMIYNGFKFVKDVKREVKADINGPLDSQVSRA